MNMLYMYMYIPGDSVDRALQTNLLLFVALLLHIRTQVHTHAVTMATSISNSTRVRTPKAIVLVAQKLSKLDTSFVAFTLL